MLSILGFGTFKVSRLPRAGSANPDYKDPWYARLQEAGILAWYTVRDIFNKPSQDDLDKRLYKAVWRGWGQIVDAALFKGANPNAKPDNHSAPMLINLTLSQREYAAYIADCLLEAGADVNARMPDHIYSGCTAAMMAARCILPDVLDVLKKYNADFQLTDKMNQTMGDYASHSGNADILVKARAMEQEQAQKIVADKINADLKMKEDFSKAITVVKPQKGMDASDVIVTSKTRNKPYDLTGGTP